MMILRSSPFSPYVRKINISARLLGLSEQIKLEPADTTNPDDSLRQQNPLGKLPTLILEDGTALFDSRVIVEYLDSLSNKTSIIPATAPQRWEALRMQALADGILDAAVLQVYEVRFRPDERRDARWTDYQAAKVGRALTILDAAPPAFNPAEIHIGVIAIACALGYLDLRFAGTWRENYPNLVTWLDQFAAAVPAYDETKPPPA